MASKLRPLKVDPKDISPNWKVLQMKLKEQASDDKESKPVKRNSMPRKRKAPAPDVPVKTKKYAEETPVGRVQEGEESGELTKIIAIDCEYVGSGEQGKDDVLARVSIVNQEGKIIYDKFVKPKAKITDYRTAVSGIRPSNLVNGLRFEDVQKEVHKLMEGRVVVGHAVHNDFRVLSLVHPRKMTRDTAKAKCIRNLLQPPTMHPSLKQLAQQILGIEIQQGEHDSIVDARVALRIYLNMRKTWEDEIRRYSVK